MKCPMNSDEPRENIPNSGANSMNDEVDFSDYVWMGEENLEEFDRKVELELWEEQFIESCFNELWRTEDQDTVYFNVPEAEPGNNTISLSYDDYAYQRPVPNHPYLRQTANPVPEQADQSELSSRMADLTVQERNGINQVSQHKLNPNAEVFVPRNVNNMTSSAAPSVDR